jgi:hypothetical protein
MGKYAEGTDVPVDRSRGEIERILTKYGADRFSAGWAPDRAVISFQIHNRHIRIEMPLPRLETGVSSWNQKKGRYYTSDSVARESRRRWRALVLYIKAKLESVASDIVSFEQAFMAHVVLPNGLTVGQAMIPQLENAYKDGKMPPLLGFSE